MALPFRSPPRSTRPDPLDTPYARAQQVWDRRMGGAVDAAQTWRWVAIAGGVLSGILALGLAFVALQARTYVHVVEVAPEGGVISVRPADPSYSPTDAQISYFLGRFVRLIRAVPTDAVVLRENWLEAYHFAGPKAAAQLNEAARNEDPFSLVGQRARTVSIRSVVQRAEKTWQVSWSETTSAPGAGSSPGQLFTGLFTVEISPPRSSEALARNPLGIFITDWSSSLETQIPGAAR